MFKGKQWFMLGVVSVSIFIIVSAIIVSAAISIVGRGGTTKVTVNQTTTTTSTDANTAFVNAQNRFVNGTNHFIELNASNANFTTLNVTTMRVGGALFSYNGSSLIINVT